MNFMLRGLWDSSEQGLHSTTKLILWITAATCPRLKSSNGHFPQLMKRARLLLSLMKAFVHWMVNFARLHPTPPMMTLPPTHPSKILKAQHPGWWLTMSYSLVFIRKLIAIINGSSISLVQFFTTWPQHTIQWRKTTSTSMKPSIVPGLFYLMSTTQKI